MRITVTVTGELVPKGMQNLLLETPRVGRQQIRTVMERIKRRMQEYPPEPSGQSQSETHDVLGTIMRRSKGRYQRTGMLGARWAIINVDTGYRIENTAQRRGREYGIYVVGDSRGDRQAWMHKGRWQLFRGVVDEETKKLPDDVEETIRVSARKKGVQ